MQVKTNYKKDKTLANILWEMTWDGFSPEEIESREKERENSIIEAIEKEINCKQIKER
jgi:hypothetical protein